MEKTAGAPAGVDGAGCVEASLSGICPHCSLQDASCSASSLLLLLGPTGSQRHTPESPACSTGGVQGGWLHQGAGDTHSSARRLPCKPFPGWRPQPHLGLDTEPRAPWFLLPKESALVLQRRASRDPARPRVQQEQGVPGPSPQGAPPFQGITLRVLGSLGPGWPSCPG